jgi:NAD dependent epimerase/dehydratase
MIRITKQVDIIFNLAALIGIPYSYIAPRSYVDTNINGTLNLLEAARINDVSRFIQTSTSEVYGSAKSVPISESHPLQPQSPYSASKIASDSISLSYYHSFGMPVTIARPFNTYGPRQSARAFIPTIIAQLITGRNTLRLGSVTPTRDLNFVSDTCKGFASLATNQETVGSAYNIGSNSEISVGEVAKLIGEIMGIEIEIKCDPSRIRPKHSEVERLVCDASMIKNLTGYEPSFSLSEGLANTIEWMRSPGIIEKYKPENYNV